MADTVDVPGQGAWPVGIALCCRRWPVLLGIRIARCGYCGTQPVVISK